MISRTTARALFGLLFLPLLMVLPGSQADAQISKDAALPSSTPHSSPPGISVHAATLFSWSEGRYSRFRSTAAANGSALGMRGGIAMDVPVLVAAPQLRLEVAAGLEHHAFTSDSEAVTENVTITIDRAGPDAQLAVVPVGYSDITTITLTYATASLALRYDLPNGLFFGAGAEAGFCLNAERRRERTIVTKVVEVPDMGMAEVYFNDGNSPYRRNQGPWELAGTTMPVWRALAWAGYAIPLSAKLSLEPRAGLTLGVGPIAEPSMRLHTVSLTLGLRHTP